MMLLLSAQEAMILWAGRHVDGLFETVPFDEAMMRVFCVFLFGDLPAIW